MARTSEPSFFKILIGDFSDRLSIPQPFHKHFDGKGPHQSQLQTPAGTWSVNVNKVNGMFFFQKGWKEFVRDHGLKLGEFLIFRYAGSSKFYIDIYGTHGCQKDQFAVAGGSPVGKEQGDDIRTTNANMKDVGSSTRHEKHNLRGSGDETKTSQPTIPIRTEPIDIELGESMDIDASMRDMDSREKLSFTHVANRTPATALEEASKFSSKLPFFRQVMTKTYVTKGFLHIPINFMNNFKIKDHTARLQVSNRLWPVKLVHYSHSARFSQGWMDFVKHNDLRVGDVCVFKLVKTDDFVMNVSVFRCAR